MGEFFQTIAKWPVFLAGSILSNVLSTFDWMKPLWANPFSATFLGALGIGLFVGLVLTLRAMLGLH